MDKSTVFVFFLAVAGLSAAADHPVYCPTGWVRYGANCMKLYTDQVNAETAESTCFDEGATLTSIYSEGEQKFHNALIMESGLSAVWMGLNDKVNEGMFTWPDLTPLDTSEYSNWAEKRPARLLGRFQNCVLLKGTEDYLTEEIGQWKDETCRMSNGFICKKPITPCPLGWDKIGTSCVKVMTKRVTFNDAQMICEEHNAKLTSIHTQDEQDYVTGKATNAGMRLWIGTTDTNDEGNFRNIDGTPLDFTNWAPGQPDNFEGPENCVHLYIRDDRDKTGTWNDNECDKTYGFICKKPQAPCPEGWTSRDKFCYLTSTEEKVYEEANIRCTELGVDATLTTIASPDEQKFHTRKVAETGMKMWIGLDDKTEEGTMVWKDGTDLTFENWVELEETGDEEDCVYMKASTTVDNSPGEWSDTSCTERGIGFMCKMPMMDTQGIESGTGETGKPSGLLPGPGDVIVDPIIAVDYTSYCPPDTTQSGAFCYMTLTTQSSFEDANRACQDMGFELTSIHSLSEQVFHEYLLRDGEDKNFWIGLTDKETEGTFVYTDGTNVDYLRWSTNQPSNEKSNEDCVIISTSFGTYGQWMTVSCAEYANTICKQPVAPCPIGWESNGDSCYLPRTNLVTYAEAAGACEDINSILTNVKSSQEQLYLTSIVEKNGIPMWIGLDDIDTEGTMVYKDGTPLVYTNWGPYQPETETVNNDEDCVYLRETYQTGEWTDVSCNTQTGYICKKPKGPCPRGFLPRDNNCYHVNMEPVTYEGAVRSCEELGATLTVIKKEDEQLFHTGAVKEAGRTLWIGLSDTQQTGTMTWADGTEITFTNWASTEPSRRANENCVYMMSDRDQMGKWNDAECTATHGYMCITPMITSGIALDSVTDVENLSSQDCETQVGWPARERGDVSNQEWTMVAMEKTFSCDGKITEWTYYPKTANPFRALVFRRVEGSTTQIKIVGVNEIPAGEINKPVTYTVPTNQQITVNAGDMIGLEFTTGVVSLNYNGNKPTSWEWWRTSTYGTPTVEQIYENPETSGRRYMEYSLMATVEQFGDIQCKQCSYETVNGIVQPTTSDIQSCNMGLETLPSSNCRDTVPILEQGQRYRCFTYLYQLTEPGSLNEVSGLQRGCTAVDIQSVYGNIDTTTDVDDIRVMLPVTWLLDNSAKLRADFCDSDNCNTGLSTGGSTLQCYECRYHEINGEPDDKATNKESCYSGVGLDLVSCSASYGPLETGYEFKCYTSPYEKTTTKGSIVVGVRRGCVPIETEKYGETIAISDIESIQEIFDFSLEEGDTQKGTATFCESSTCNTEDITVTECDYCEVMSPCPDWATCVNLDKEVGWTCNAPVNICPSNNPALLGDLSEGFVKEQNLVENTDYSVRLTEGVLDTEGLVEIYRRGTWAKVCSGDFTFMTATVICQQLGYPYANKFYQNYDVEPIMGALYFSAVSCIGTESSLEECLLTETSTETCSPVMAVQCLPEPSVMTARLVGGENDYTGRLEVKYNQDTYGTVCDDSFSLNSATVVCRMLGFPEAISFTNAVQNDEPLVSDNTMIVLDDLVCFGSEKNLLECPRLTALWQHNCDHTEDVYVTCMVPENGALRLVNSPTLNQGRLEIMHDGEYATICDSLFGVREANTACKQLGFAAVENLSRGFPYGSGTGTPYPHVHTCLNGIQSSLAMCTIDEDLVVGDFTCSHEQDVGLECFTELPEVRLAGGDTESEGRVEMYYDGEWGSVCDDGFGMEEAHIVCQSMGYIEAVGVYTNAYFGEGTGPIILDDVRCYGTEEHIVQCQHAMPLKETNCDHDEDVSVRCKVPEFGDLRQSSVDKRLEVYYEGTWGTVCDDFWGFQDSKVVCNQLGFKYVNTSMTVLYTTEYPDQVPILLDEVECSGDEGKLIDCPANPVGEHNCGHDEDIIVNCMQGGMTDVRLVGGSVPSEGRVEVMYNDEWGSVCDDSWGMEEAKVICKSLGYADAAEAPGSSSFGEGEGSIFFDDLGCTGTEESLFDCVHNGFKINNCDHMEDAGVVCVAPVEGDLRPSPIDNRLEVYHENTFGTVCDDDWTFENARVVCRQMGFKYANMSYSIDTPLGDDLQPTWLDNVACIGTESKLVDCAKNEWGDENCMHEEDIVVTCLPDVAISLELVGGETPNEGRVEMTYEGKAGTICDDNFDIEDATVVCKQLGFTGADSYSTIGEGTGPIYLDELACEGTEEHILDCARAGIRTGFGVHDCDHSEDIAVVCTVEELTNECYSDKKAMQYRGIVSTTRTGKTCQKWTSQEPHSHDRTQENYPGFGLGDYNYCRNPDNEPEGAWCYTMDTESRWEYCEVGEPRECPTSEKEGQLRVSNLDGRLDVYHNEEWGTVCNDFWDSKDATVACRQMGYTFFSRTYTIDPFSPTMPIWMDNVLCVGTETRLDKCDFRPWGDSDCTNEENIGVECLTGTLCDTPLGMEDRRIKDSQMTATDSYTWYSVFGEGDENYGPQYARLNEDWCWSTHMTSDQWIQVTFEKTQYVSGVITQGYRDAWVEIFQIEFTEDGTNWQYVTGPNGEEKFFTANSDPDTPVTNKFFKNILVKAIRLRPTTFNTWIHLRMELLGCPTALDCETTVGWAVQDRTYLDTASQYTSVSPSMQFTCDGEVTEWRFQAQASNPLRAIVFRPIEGSTTQFKVVGFNDIPAPEVDTPITYTVPQNEIITVRTGDVIGWHMEEASLTYDFWGNNVLYQYNLEINSMDQVVDIAGGSSSRAYSIQATLKPFGGEENIIELRLADGATPNEGRVELKLNGTYGTICDDSFTDEAATVICKQLGYTTFASWTITTGGTGPIYLDNVECTGTEQHVLDCAHSDIGVTNCVHDEDVKVVCLSDEGPVADGTLRLRGGGHEAEGRIEVHYRGRWGSICDDGWKFAEANVACKQLGFPGAINATGGGFFPPGSFNILLDDFKCKGTEATLTDCPNAGWTVHNCGQEEIAGLKCYPKECSQPLGMEDGRISDLQITATDYYSWIDPYDIDTTFYTAQESRLNGDLAWATHMEDVYQYLQVMFYEPRYVSAVITQGHNDAWVTSFKVEYMGDDQTWKMIKTLDQQDKVFTANTDSDTQVTNTLPETVRVTSIRIRPQTWYRWIHLRLELLGCETPPSETGITPPRVRLMNGDIEGTSEGRVEIEYNGEWNTVCDDEWGIQDGDVVCKQLGYTRGAMFATTTAKFGQGTGTILFDDVDCVGTETNLAYCLHRGYDVSNCGHAEDAGVICAPNTDETDIEVRLVGGQTTREGRVEVAVGGYGNGEYGTICDDKFDIKDATVICRMLGYKAAAVALTVERFKIAPGTGLIMLDDLECDGTEESLMDCTHNGFTVNDCEHTEDVAIRCLEDTDIPLPVRLRDGTGSNSGRVEVYVGGAWGTVCDDFWTEMTAMANANVVCNSLGFNGAIRAMTSLETVDGSEEMPIVVDDLQCDGSEIAIEYCNHAGLKFKNCGHGEDIGVICRNWQNGDLKLVDGNKPNEGRLTVYYEGDWGLVCDDDFDATAANVACTQLGYSSEGNRYFTGRFGSNFVSSFFLDNVVCLGTETKLSACENNGWEIHNCFSHEAIELACAVP